MNCKPGDLAIVVRCLWEENIGGMVEVLDSYRCDPGEWRVKAITSLKATVIGVARPGSIVWADDFDLRPIRPGETPQQSTEAMRDLTSIPAPVRKETV
jgi:hypothetical protein